MSVQDTTAFVPVVDEFSMENTQDIDARPSAGGSDNVIQSGWGAAVSAAKPTEYAKDFKLTEQLQVIKFLDTEGPYAVYSQHFLTQKTEGQRSYICVGTGCPLCLKLNNKAEKKHAFTVAVLSPAETIHTRLIASPLFFRSLQAANASAAGPLQKNYWAVARKGAMQQTVYTLNPVKGRDLAEDWGIDEAKVLTALESMQPFSPTTLRRFSIEELDEIANALV